MSRLDLIIDALDQAYLALYSAGYSHLIEDSEDAKLLVKALTAARSLKAMKPVAWASPSIYGELEGLSFDKQPRFDIPLYSIDGEQA